MSKLIAYRERMKLIADEMGPLAQKDERGADEESKLDTLIAEFNDLGEKATREANIEATLKRAQGQPESNGRVSGLRPAEGAEERQQADRRSLGQRFAESEHVKEWLASGTAPKSRAMKVGRLDGYDGALPEYRAEDGAIEQRALIYTGGLPGQMIPDQVLPTIYRPRDYPLTMRDVLVSGRTTSDTIYFIRELAFTNAAVEVAQATATTGASGTKPESTLTFEQASVPVVTIAHWVPITRQAIADAAQLQSYIEGRLLVGLDRRLNGQILNGDGAGANMTGILNTSGVQLFDNTPTTGYWAVNPLPSVGTDRENFDRLLHAFTAIDLVGDAEATFVSMNPADIERFQTVADLNGAYMAGGPFSAGTVPLIWGRRVVKERSVPEGTAVVGDGTMAGVFDREDANILIDTINDQFIRNMLTILAELRAALAVFRPAAFGEVQLAAW